MKKAKWSAYVGILSTVACSSTGTGGSETDPEEARVGIAEVTRELSPGDSGPDVRAVHDYLLQYGYFPNAALKEQYPHWRPVVLDSPEDPSSFGAEMQEAVLAFQLNSGLEPTGAVDRRTIDMLKAARCAHPENELAELDESEKFSSLGFHTTKTTLTYRITQYTADMSGSAANLAIAQAFLELRNNSKLNFNQITSGTPDIEIKFFPGDSPPPGWNPLPEGALAEGRPNRISINDTVDWGAPLAETYDLRSVVTHEAGHSVGLAHSNVLAPNRPVMYPLQFKGVINSGYTTDDRMSIGVHYHVWRSRTSSPVIRDIASNAGGRTWAIGDGDKIYYWNGTGWSLVPGVGTSIAVDNFGNPWVTSTGNTIYRSVGGGPWMQVLGSARELAGGYGGGFWAVTTTPTGTGDGNYLLQRFNGIGWDLPDGFGVHVAVDSNNLPIVIRANGDVYRRTNPNVWAKLPGCLTDVAGGPSKVVWGLGCADRGGGNRSVYIWNEQRGITDHATEEFSWREVGSTYATRIGVNFDAMPWIVQANGATLSRSTR